MDVINHLRKFPGKVYHFGAILLTVLFTLKFLYWYSSGTANYYEVPVLLFLIGSHIALVMKKPVGLKLAVISGGVGYIYYLYDVLVLSVGFNLAAAVAVPACMLSFFLYRIPSVKQTYLTGFDAPHWSILVVDDDKTFLKMIKSTFTRAGMNVLTAESGEKGLEIALSRPPDLIILDVILPGMKGREVCAKLKEDSRTRDVPIIFLTIKDSKEDITAEMEAGAILHLTKPVDLKMVYAEIQKILG